VVGVMAGHLHLQLRHCASVIVAVSNIAYCQMLLFRGRRHIHFEHRRQCGRSSYTRRRSDAQCRRLALIQVNRIE
jgi:hypothetical protein